MTEPRFIVLATKNRGKAIEFSALLGPDIAFKTLDDMNLESPEETGDTFAENARIKAVEISNLVNALVIADDSGLEVDALGGAPGVRSARYAGEPSNEERNIELLLQQLEKTEDAERTGRFVCAVVVARGGEVLLTGEGRCEGRIGYERRGNNGFGYDFVFYLDNGQTMADLQPEEKNRLSHRAMAYRSVSQPLYALFNELIPAGEHQR